GSGKDEVVFVLFEVLDGHVFADPLAFTQLQQVHDRPSATGARRFGNLIDLDLEYATGVGEAKQVIVRGSDEHLFGEIVLLRRRTDDAAPAATLRAVGIHRQPL